MNAKTLREILNAQQVGKQAAPSEPASRLVIKDAWQMAGTDSVYTLQALWRSRAVVPEKDHSTAVYVVTEHARRQLVAEFYGEIHEELFRLLDVVYADRYLPSEHPIRKQIDRLLELTRP